MIGFVVAPGDFRVGNSHAMGNRRAADVNLNRYNFAPLTQKTPLLPRLFSPTSRFYFIPALMAHIIASALACLKKYLKFLGVVVEKSRGSVHRFFPVGLI